MADETWTILRALTWTAGKFQERGLPSSRLDAEVLLADVLGVDRMRLYTHFDQPLGKDELAAYRERIKRRLGGESVAYLTGRREFWSLPFQVDARVLVPRPETEGVVEAALAALAGRRAPTVADVGTGSGAIACAIAHERPDARVVAVDRSADALAVAAANARALEVEVELLEGDLLAPLGPFAPLDAICSNPPYVADGDWDALPPEVKREPRGALLAGADGLDALRRLVDGAPPLLAPGGALILEVGAGQARQVAELMRARGFATVEVRKDLAGIERVVVARAAG